MAEAKAARERLETLEAQLRRAMRRGEPPETFVRRYYLPMFAAAVALGDYDRAGRVRKKIGQLEVAEPDLGGWFNVSFNYERGQYRLAEAQAVAERHLQWARERSLPPEESIALFNMGLVAAERRDFAAAEAWYRKALAIEEKQENEHGAATTYHQLGTLAQERRDFVAAEACYRRSLAIKEKQGNEHGAATTYHQLGTLAQERRDFAAAEAWYRKSLAVKEKQGNEHGAATTYHQLGILAQEQRDFAAAAGWYRKSLAVDEKQGNEHSAAISYHQLGRIAQEQRDFAAAEAWYRKSLAIEEKQGDEHHAAMSYYQLGRVAEEQRDFAGAGRFFLKALGVFAAKNDPYHAEMARKGFVRLLRSAPPEIRAGLRGVGRAALGEERMREAEASLAPPSLKGSGSSP
ncbi:MAG TPA: tetratricopeptide repeat protein [Dongiaceae bacterium]|nr:tetratricopeptide repeat protein [Dongiaceae bacterium]